MQKDYRKKLLSCILCIVLTVAMALVTIGCNGKTDKQDSKAVQTEGSAGGDTSDTKDIPDVWPDGSVIGEGSKQFTLSVVDADGNTTKLEIHMEQKTVGEALSELGVIDGDESEYGLYVTKANGISANYDTDGTYWAFYINEEYAQTGVDSTEIKEGDSYSLKLEKA